MTRYKYKGHTKRFFKVLGTQIMPGGEFEVDTDTDADMLFRGCRDFVVIEESEPEAPKKRGRKKKEVEDIIEEGDSNGENLESERDGTEDNVV